MRKEVKAGESRAFASTVKSSLQQALNKFNETGVDIVFNNVGLQPPSPIALRLLPSILPQTTPYAS